MIDRIVALVNGQPVLLSEWQDRVRYEAMLEQRPLENVSSEQEQEALRQVIDQKLVEQQMRGRNLPPVSNEEIATRTADVKKRVPVSEGGWQETLKKYSLTEDQVLELVRAQAGMARFVTAEVLAGVRVEDQSILTYYRETLLPQLRGSGAAPPALGEVAGRIREVLLQQRTNELLDQWLQTLRDQSEVRMVEAQSPAQALPGDKETRNPQSNKFDRKEDSMQGE
ncbi:MAG: hypothetical protein AB7V46_24890 [Thermomicrobiales bacterium]